MKNPKVTVLEGVRQSNEKEFYERWWFKGFVRALSSLVNKIPPLRRYLSKTASGMLGISYQYLKAKNYAEALRICNEGLIRFRNKTDCLGHYDWWEFMKYAACAAYNLDDNEQKLSLISMGENGIEPFEGNAVAVSFCYFSRWRFQEQDYEAAIDYAQRAKNADAKCSEAHFLLGWYALFIDQSDPVEHFRTAIAYDNEYLARITSEPAIEEFPHIIGELRKLSIVREEIEP